MVQGKNGVASYGSYCYDAEEDSCSIYGRLYTWAAAMDSAGVYSSSGAGCGSKVGSCSPKYPLRGVCPEGWHLPKSGEGDWLFLQSYLLYDMVSSGADMEEIEQYYTIINQSIESDDATVADTTTARKLISQTGWDGLKFSAMDDLGFAVLPAGVAKDGRNHVFQGVGRFAFYWSSTKSDTNACGISIDVNNGFTRGCTAQKNYGYSVRCVKD